MPLVSVMMPVYDTEPFVRRAMRSVLDQSYPVVELIIVNDASPDDAESAIKEIATQYPQAHITYLRHETNGGLASARITALQHAQGEYLLWLDSDDYLTDGEVIARWIDLAERTRADVVYSDYYGAFASGLQLYPQGEYPTAEALLTGILTGQTPAFLPTKLIRRAVWPSEAHVAGQDVFEDVAAMVTLLALRPDLRIAHLPLPTLCYVQYNEGSLITTISHRRFEQIATLYRRIEIVSASSPLDLRSRLDCLATHIQRILIDKSPRTQYSTIRTLLGRPTASSYYATLPAYDRLWAWLILEWRCDRLGSALIQFKHWGRRLIHCLRTRKLKA